MNALLARRYGIDDVVAITLNLEDDAVVYVDSRFDEDTSGGSLI